MSSLGACGPASAISGATITSTAVVTAIDKIAQGKDNAVPEEETAVEEPVAEPAAEPVAEAAKTLTATEEGFGGDIEVTFGVDENNTIVTVDIGGKYFAETPGLGAKAAEWFQEGGKGNVVGKNPSNEPSGELKVKKDNGTVDAISGSTITSRAFCELVNKAFQVVNTISNDQQKGDIE